MNERRQDFELLQAFARHGEQSVFADVVRRHLDLVYATALRKVEDAGAAQEVAQNVFTALARKAWQFAPDDSLPAWLHKTALLESKAWLRGELRRRRREETAAALGTTMKIPNEEPAFNALVPLLDDALLSLREKDRTALLLRFYENQSLREVGAALGTSDDTAQKRVQSALEKLSDFFKCRGFKTATVAATTAALQHTAASASTTVAGAVVSTALQATPPVVIGFTALIARVASMSKVQTAVVCGAIAIVPLAWQWKQVHEAEKATAALQVKLDALRIQNEETVAALERSRAEATGLEEAQAAMSPALARERAALQKLADLKSRSRALLTGENYRWPDDLPFVRVPKSAVSSIRISGGPNTPAQLESKVSRFLDLSPQEREITGQIFTNYFAAIDHLFETRLYETNQATSIKLPAGAESKVFVLLPMGEKIRAAMDQLCTDLAVALGEQRWSMVKPEKFEFTRYEQVRLMGYTQYAWDQRQEIVVNVFANAGGEPTASWTSSTGTGTGPMPLRSFQPGKLPAASIFRPDGPRLLVDRVTQWLASEATVRLPNPATK